MLARRLLPRLLYSYTRWVGIEVGQHAGVRAGRLLQPACAQFAMASLPLDLALVHSCFLFLGADRGHLVAVVACLVLRSGIGVERPSTLRDASTPWSQRHQHRHSQARLQHIHVRVQYSRIGASSVKPRVKRRINAAQYKDEQPSSLSHRFVSPPRKPGCMR